MKENRSPEYTVNCKFDNESASLIMNLQIWLCVCKYDWEDESETWETCMSRSDFNQILGFCITQTQEKGSLMIVIFHAKYFRTVRVIKHAKSAKQSWACTQSVQLVHPVGCLYFNTCATTSAPIFLLAQPKNLCICSAQKRTSAQVCC